MLQMNRFRVWVLSLAGLLAGTTCKGGDGVKVAPKAEEAPAADAE